MELPEIRYSKPETSYLSSLIDNQQTLFIQEKPDGLDLE